MKQKVLDQYQYRSSYHPIHNDRKSFGSPHPVQEETKSCGSTPLPHPLDATANDLKWQSISSQQF